MRALRPLIRYRLIGLLIWFLCPYAHSGICMTQILQTWNWFNQGRLLRELVGFSAWDIKQAHGFLPLSPQATIFEAVKHYSDQHLREGDPRVADDLERDLRYAIVSSVEIVGKGLGRGAYAKLVHSLRSNPKAVETHFFSLTFAVEKLCSLRLCEPFKQSTVDNELFRLVNEALAPLELSLESPEK